MYPARDELLARARIADALGDFRTSASCLEAAAALTPTDGVALVLLGQVYMELEQYSAARVTFERAIAVSPDLAAAHSGLGQALEAVRQLPEAAEAYARAVQVAPTASRYVLLGSVERTLGRDSEAEISLRQALELEPDNEEAHFNLALVIRHSQPHQAIQHLERAVAIDPLFAEAHCELGFELVGQERFTEAESTLRTAAELRSDDPWPRIYLGNMLWQLNRVAEAEAQFEEAIAIAPLWSMPYYLLGTLYESIGELEKAARQFNSSVETDATDANAAFHLGHFFATVGRPNEARVWLRRALGLDPNHARASQLLKSL